MSWRKPLAALARCVPPSPASASPSGLSIHISGFLPDRPQSITTTWSCATTTACSPPPVCHHTYQLGEGEVVDVWSSLTWSLLNGNLVFANVITRPCFWQTRTEGLPLGGI
jgi:hypothetical protein